MAEVKAILIAVILTSLFGFGMFAFVVDFADESDVKLDENYTELMGTFGDTVDDVSDLGDRMREQTESKGGFTVTTAGFILLNSIYTIAKIPYDLIKIVPNAIVKIGSIVGIPTIYTGAALTILTITLTIAIISLLFRKDY